MVKLSKINILRTSFLCKPIARNKPTSNIRSINEEYIVEIGSFQAKMTDLVRFLHEIRMAPGLMSISKLTVTPEKDKRGSVRGSVVITKIMLPGTDAADGS